MEASYVKDGDQEMSLGEAILLIAIIIFFVSIIVVGGTWEQHDTLVNEEQGVKANKSMYTKSVYITSLKMEASWKVLTRYLPHESSTFIEAAESRSQFYKAAENGNSEATVEAALAFQVQALSINEDFPELVSAPLAMQTQSELVDAINQTSNSFDSWMNSVKIYNEDRQSLWGKFVGGYLFNFPLEYSYYEFDGMEVNASEILK